MYVKDLGRCFEKTGYPLRMTANNDKRIILEGKEFFYYFMRRERRQEKYLQGRENGIFLSHDTRMKQIIERRQGIWDGLQLSMKCVCVCRIIKDIVALFAERYNVCDDTFIENENVGAWRRGKS